MKKLVCLVTFYIRTQIPFRVGRVANATKESRKSPGSVFCCNRIRQTAGVFLGTTKCSLIIFRLKKKREGPCARDSLAADILGRGGEEKLLKLSEERRARLGHVQSGPATCTDALAWVPQCVSRDSTGMEVSEAWQGGRVPGLASCLSKLEAWGVCRVSVVGSGSGDFRFN